MEPLEQVTVLMTLMRRLIQVMDHERAILRSLRLDVLPDLQDEKVALADRVSASSRESSPKTSLSFKIASVVFPL